MSAIVNAVRAKITLKSALIVGGATVGLALLGAAIYVASKTTGGVVAETFDAVIDDVIDVAVDVAVA